MGDGNGLDQCAAIELLHMLDGKLDSWREEVNPNLLKVADMHQTIAKSITHLSKLDSIDDSLEQMRDKLVDKATGKNQWDGKVVSYLVMILGTVIVGLLFVLVFVLTGQRFGLINLPH